MSENRGHDPDALPALLRARTREHDLHVRAAVELLIGHGTWLRRADFTQACVNLDARRYVGSGPGGSASELAILDLAVAIGENRYQLSIMGQTNAWLIAYAVARAVGAD